jgi:hypothetical protein
VHIANVLAETQPDFEAAGNELDAEYLSRVGVTEEFSTWSELARQHFATEVTG